MLEKSRVVALAPRVAMMLVLLWTACNPGRKQQEPAQKGSEPAGVAAEPTPDPAAVSSSAGTEQPTAEQKPVVLEPTEEPEPRYEARTFREGVVVEMEQVLGGRPRTRQGAINAAYLKHGWAYRTDSTPEQDRQAYLQALSWGFHINDFIARGRDGRFHASELASGPIDPRRWHPYRSSPAAATDMVAMSPPSDASPARLPPAAAELPARQRPAPAPPRRPLTARERRALGHVGQGLSRVDRKLADVDESLRWVEGDKQRMNHPLPKQRRKMAAMLSRMEKMLSTAEADLAKAIKQIQSLEQK